MSEVLEFKSKADPSTCPHNILAPITAACSRCALCGSLYYHDDLYERAA